MHDEKIGTEVPGSLSSHTKRKDEATTYCRQMHQMKEQQNISETEEQEGSEHEHIQPKVVYAIPIAPEKAGNIICHAALTDK